MKKFFIQILLFLSILTLVLFSSADTTLSCGDCVPLSKYDYTLKTYNINKDNKWATFRDENNGIFFIHSGKKDPSTGVFTFKQNLNLILTLSIRSGSKVGDINFRIKKNNLKSNELIITPRITKQIFISIVKNDTLTIIADKHGATSADWGNLKIENLPDSVQYTLSEIYNNIIIYKNKVVIFLLLSIMFLLYIKFKNHHLLHKFEKSSLFEKTFQIILKLFFLFGFFLFL